jgi:hypothetical protein
MQILDAIGIGSSGPPLPPPVTLAIIYCPMVREPYASAKNGNICFVLDSESR